MCLKTPLAVREAVINAVAHADYTQRGAPIRLAIFDDRLEVESPGLLPFGLTIEELQHGISKLCNHVISRVLHALGLVEQWGSGIDRMTDARRDAGIPPPTLQEIDTHFRVTLSTQRITSPSVDQKTQTILQALADTEGLLTNEMPLSVRLAALGSIIRFYPCSRRKIASRVLRRA